MLYFDEIPVSNNEMKSHPFFVLKYKTGRNCYNAYKIPTKKVFF